MRTVSFFFFLINNLLTESSNNTSHHGFQTANKSCYKSECIPCFFCQLAKYQLNADGIYPAILFTIRFEGTQLYPFFSHVLHKSLSLNMVFLLSSPKKKKDYTIACDTNVNFLITPPTTFTPVLFPVVSGGKGSGQLLSKSVAISTL